MVLWGGFKMLFDSVSKIWIITPVIGQNLKRVVLTIDQNEQHSRVSASQIDLSSMKKTLILGAALTLALPSLIGAELEVALTPYTGNGDISAKVTLNDTVVPGGIRMTIDIVDAPPTGDLRGFFFSVDPFIADLALSGGPEISNFTAADDGVINIAGMNLNPSPRPGGVGFDYGFEIGTNGIGGGDDFQTVTVDLTSVSNGPLSLDIFTDFGLRITSIGDTINGDREDSSKLYGTPEGTPPIPEPSEYAFAFLVMLGGFVVWRRRTAAAV